METGKNRFFNICEAYQSMLGKSDSVARDARRYRMVNESVTLDDRSDKKTLDSHSWERVSAPHRVDEMAMHKISSVLQNPAILASNWDEVVNILDSTLGSYGQEFPTFFEGNPLIELIEKQNGKFEFSQFLDEYKNVRWVLCNAFDVEGEDIDGRFLNFLVKRGYEYFEDGRKYGFRNGNDIIYITSINYNEYQPIDSGRFKNLCKEYLAQYGADATGKYCYYFSDFGLNGVICADDKIGAARKLCNLLQTQGENSKVYKILSQYLFDDDDENYEEVFSHADELGDEQYRDSVMAQGSDPYGDRDFTRMEYLSKNIPRSKWAKFGIFDPREEIRRDVMMDMENDY